MIKPDTLAHELRTLAGEVDQFVGGRGTSRHAWHVMLISSIDCMHEAADTIDALRKQIAKCQIAELKADYDTSRYFELFGTPERAARTLANLFANCNNGFCFAPEPEDATYDALLELLRGDTE